MGIPKITYRLIFQEGVVNTLGINPPYDECQCIIQCNEHIKQLIVRSTFEDEERGRDKGTLVVEMSNRPANTDIPFTINSHTAMNKGDGSYFITLYVCNDQDIWNQYLIYQVYGTGSGRKIFQDREEKVFCVKEE